MWHNRTWLTSPNLRWNANNSFSVHEDSVNMFGLIQARCAHDKYYFYWLLTTNRFMYLGVKLGYKLPSVKMTFVTKVSYQWKLLQTLEFIIIQIDHYLHRNSLKVVVIICKYTDWLISLHKLSTFFSSTAFS